VGSSREGGRVGAFVSEFLCLASFCLSVTFFFEKTCLVLNLGSFLCFRVWIFLSDFLL